MHILRFTLIRSSQRAAASSARAINAQLYRRSVSHLARHDARSKEGQIEKREEEREAKEAGEDEGGQRRGMMDDWSVLSQLRSAVRKRWDERKPGGCVFVVNRSVSVTSIGDLRAAASYWH